MSWGQLCGLDMLTTRTYCDRDTVPRSAVACLTPRDGAAGDRTRVMRLAVKDLTTRPQRRLNGLMIIIMKKYVSVSSRRICLELVSRPQWKHFAGRLICSQRSPRFKIRRAKSWLKSVAIALCSSMIVQRSITMKRLVLHLFAAPQIPQIRGKQSQHCSHCFGKSMKEINSKVTVERFCELLRRFGTGTN